MSRREDAARLRAERDAARQSADLMAEALRNRKTAHAAEMHRLAARLEHAEALLREHGISAGPWCRPMPASEWLSRQNLEPDHPVRLRQGIIL